MIMRFAQYSTRYNDDISTFKASSKEFREQFGRVECLRAAFELIDTTGGNSARRSNHFCDHLVSYDDYA